MLEALYLFTKASHNISFLMPWCALNSINDFADLHVLVLEILYTLLLPPVLSNKVLHVRIALDINQLLPQSLCILINEVNELLSDSHNHVPDVVLPRS